MNVDVKLNLNKKLIWQIENLPDKVIYKIARKTLDFSPQYTPKRSGEMRLKTMEYGVRGSNADYHIGSPIGYATRVWNLSDNSTNWTTPGTGNKWFIKSLKKNQQTIVDGSISEAVKEG